MNTNFRFDEEKGILTVPTQKGDIVVTVGGDSDYRGVYIDFKSKDVKESVNLLEEDVVQLARFEYDAINKELKASLWEDQNNEDCSYQASFNSALIFD